MTREEFERDFKVTIDARQISAWEVDVVSRAVRRSNGQTVARVRTIIDVLEMQEKINDSWAPNSLTPWNWEKVIDRMKRAHLDYFAQEFPIDGFFPQNLDVDVSSLYK